MLVLSLTTTAQLQRTIVKWLSPLNFFITQKDIIDKWQAGTGQWLLDSPSFKSWVSSAGSTLWCAGIRMSFLKSRRKPQADMHFEAGAGKTVLAYVNMLGLLE
jgi:hypothetical protein